MQRFATIAENEYSPRIYNNNNSPIFDGSREIVRQLIRWIEAIALFEVITLKYTDEMDESIRIMFNESRKNALSNVSE